jgi:hypothetical protein
MSDRNPQHRRCLGHPLARREHRKARTSRFHAQNSLRLHPFSLQCGSSCPRGAKSGVRLGLRHIPRQLRLRRRLRVLAQITDPGTASSILRAPPPKTKKRNNNLAADLVFQDPGRPASGPANTPELPDPGRANISLGGGLLPLPGRMAWASLLQRVYLYDVLACPCGGAPTILLDVSEPDLVRTSSTTSESPPTHPTSQERATPPTTTTPEPDASTERQRELEARPHPRTLRGPAQPGEPGPHQPKSALLGSHGKRAAAWTRFLWTTRICAPWCPTCFRIWTGPLARLRS